MGAHGGTWTRTTAKGNAVAGAGFKAETLNWSEQEAFEDDSRQRNKERRHMDAHAGEWKLTSAWTRIASCNLQPNAINKMPRYRRGTTRCRCASLYINE